MAQAFASILDSAAKQPNFRQGGPWVFRPTLLDHTQYVRAVSGVSTRAGEGRRIVYTPKKDEPISDLSTATTSGKSQGSRSQKKNRVANFGCGCKEKRSPFCFAARAGRVHIDNCV